MLQHVPHGHGRKRRRIGIDKEPPLLKPLPPGRIDIVTEDHARLPPPQIDESPRADADIDQRAAEMPFDEFAARRHQAAPELGISIAREPIEVSLVVGRNGRIDRVVADARFRPPGQAAIRKFVDQRSNWPTTSAIVLSQLCSIFVHRQNFSGMAKPMRLKSSRGSVIFSGALWPPCPPSTMKVFVRSASPIGTIQPTPPTTTSATRTSPH